MNTAGRTRPPVAAADAAAVVATARALLGDRSAAPLRGRNIALISAAPEGDRARAFDAAARALGARVAHIAPGEDWLEGAAGLDAARLLDRLYDAVDCEDLPDAFADRLRGMLTVPVLDGLAAEDHPVFDLLPALALPGAPAGEAERRALIQALLLRSLVT